MPDLPNLTTSFATKNSRWMLGAFGGGAGVTVAVAAIQALKARPEFLTLLVNGGGLWLAALAIGMVMFRKQLDSFNAIQERHVAASERLAANVGALVNKDDQRAREQDLLLNHLARQSDAILAELALQKKALGIEQKKALDNS